MKLMEAHDYTMYEIVIWMNDWSVTECRCFHKPVLEHWERIIVLLIGKCLAPCQISVLPLRKLLRAFDVSCFHILLKALMIQLLSHTGSIHERSEVEEISWAWRWVGECRSDSYSIDSKSDLPTYSAHTVGQCRRFTTYYESRIHPHIHKLFSNPHYTITYHSGCADSQGARTSSSLSHIEYIDFWTKNCLIKL